MKNKTVLKGEFKEFPLKSDYQSRIYSPEVFAHHLRELTLKIRRDKINHIINKIK